jgi:hypothetical protein
MSIVARSKRAMRQRIEVSFDISTSPLAMVRTGFRPRRKAAPVPLRPAAWQLDRRHGFRAGVSERRVNPAINETSRKYRRGGAEFPAIMHYASFMGYGSALSVRLGS